jgi:hypothetical protein
MFEIDAATVVAHLDHQHAGAGAPPAAPRPAPACLRQAGTVFDAMVHGIAQQVADGASSFSRMSRSIWWCCR